MNSRILKIVLILGVSSMLMTGCSITDITDNGAAAIGSRIDANIAVLSKLHDNGIIDDKVYESTANTLEKSKGKFEDLDKNSNDLLNSVAWVNKEVHGEDYCECDSDSCTIPDHHRSHDKLEEVHKHVKVANNPAPFRLIGDSEKALVESVVDNKIYVLRPDLSDRNTLDNITKELKKLKEQPVKDRKDAGLGGYFKLTDIQLLDQSNPDNVLIKQTVPLCDKTSKAGPGGVTDSFSMADLGKDMYFASSNHVGFGLRLEEFNPVAVDKLIGGEGTKDKFLRIGNRLYLMEYPISIIEKFSIDENTEDKFNSQYMTMSNVYVNILNGQIKDKDGNIMQDETEEDKMYQIYGDGVTGEIGQSSFILSGSVTMSGIGHDPNKEIQTGRVILRDYVELLPSNELVSGENMVATGRRIRILNTKGSVSTELGKFIDKKGDVVINSPTLYITDIIDVNSNNTDNSGKALKLALKRESATNNSNNTDTSRDNSIPVVDNVNGSEVIGGNVEEGTANSNEIISVLSNYSLTTEYVNVIKAVTSFPGTLVGIEDYNNPIQGRLQMFGMATDVSPFNSALFSGWINVTSETTPSGSLLWWNKWLSEHNFRYSVLSDALTAMIQGDISFENSNDTNKIVLDLNTIGNIQKEYNEDARIQNVSFIRTIFAIAGLLLMGYSLLLIGAWVFDINTVATPRALGALTGGKWVAIQNSSEIPNMDTHGRYYMTFKNLFRGAVIIILIGLAFMFVDVIAIIQFIINLFGSLARMISSILFGF